jgi:hypothetical protein
MVVLQAILVFYSATTIERDQHPTLDNSKSTKIKTNLSNQKGERQHHLIDNQPF